MQTSYLMNMRLWLRARAQVFDIETGIDETVIDLNPGGWIPGVTTEKSWNM